MLGAGGGVATTAVGLGSALGARVYVTSSSDEKLAGARELGDVRYDDSAWPEAARGLAGGFDLVLDSVVTWHGAAQVEGGLREIRMVRRRQHGR